MAAPAEAEPVLFQAVCTPPRSLSPTGLRVLAAVLGGCAGVTALIFLLLGAWPMVPIMGGEVGFVLGMVALHMRRSARCMEVLLLTPARLSVTRMDGRGRWEETVLDPYWARVDLMAQPGRAGMLRLVSRGRRVEIGRDLGAEEKESLGEALQAALAKARRPDFDNPQLRDPAAGPLP